MAGTNWTIPVIRPAFRMRKAVVREMGREHEMINWSFPGRSRS